MFVCEKTDTHRSMKLVKSLLALLVLSLISAGNSPAITADELAAYLGVSSWHTVVDLPPESFAVELYEFVDGHIKDANLITIPEFAKHPETGLTIMVGSRDEKYRFSLMGLNGTYGVATEEATFAHTIGSGLPAKIKEGDFVLFGEPLGGELFHDSTDLHSFSKGFLLRIKKRE